MTPRRIVVVIELLGAKDHSRVIGRIEEERIGGINLDPFPAGLSVVHVKKVGATTTTKKKPLVAAGETGE